MKKHLLPTLAFIMLFVSAATAQSNDVYGDWIKKAGALFKDKQYRQSADAFTKAFASFGGKGFSGDRYNAACAWAMAGNKDSAFFMLTRIATMANFTGLSQLLADSDLESLHSDKRWTELCAIVKDNKEKAEANLDKKLVAELDTIFQDDQGDRMRIEEVQSKYGRDSKETKDLWKSIGVKDSIDLIKVKHILDERGWLGADVVGGQGNATLFLVIQHADIKTQEHYLPMMREAVKNKKAQPSSLALLEDRVALRQGRKQIYGSQIGIDKDGHYYVDDLADPDNVDNRRTEVGLGPLSQYVQHWGLTWDVAEYKKQLPEIEKMHKDSVHQ